MVRLTTISNILAGIGLAVLGFSIGLKYLLESLNVSNTSYPFYMWVGGAGILGIVVLFTIINTFTEITGYVHPMDKLVGNMFVFLFAIAAILAFGILDEGVLYQEMLFGVASMIVIAFVFLFIFVYFSSTILEGEETGQLKEMTARFMMVSLVLGAIMAVVKVGLDYVYTTYKYSFAALILGGVALGLVVIIALILIRKYEPVGGE